MNRNIGRSVVWVSSSLWAIHHQHYLRVEQSNSSRFSLALLRNGRLLQSSPTLPLSSLVYSQLSRKRTPSGIDKSVHWWSCPLTRNYSHKWTPKKNRVDVRLQGSLLAGVNILLGSQKQQMNLFLDVMSNERTAWENRSPLICCSVKSHIFVGLQ